MIKKTLLLTSLIFLSLASNAFSETDKKNDLKYLETKVLYSQKQAQKNLWFDYKRALFVASKENKYVLLSFCREDNLFCNKMYDKTFKDPKVKAYLESYFVPIKIDSQSEDRIESNKSMLEKDLVKEFDIDGFPTIAFLNSQGESISGLTKGYVEPDKFLIILKYIATESYKRDSLKKFERMEKNKQEGK
jgi:thioredoxin-related protein